MLLIVGATVAYFWSTQTEALAVRVETIGRRNLQAIVSASGKIQPARQVNISANQMGKVTRLEVEEGQRVTTGQFLLEIDPASLAGQIERGEAGVAAAKSGLEQTRTLIKQANVNLALAIQLRDRQEELSKEGLATREELDRARSSVDGREAELDSRERELETRQQQIRQEEASLQTIRYNLSQIVISAPMDGIITRRNIEEGETAVVGTMNNPGTVLLTIADMSIIEATVEVDETDIPTVFIGQEASITIDAVPNEIFLGTVTEISNSPIQAASGQIQGATNFEVVITLKGEVQDVRPGFTCTAEIVTAQRPETVAVPIQALTVRELLFDQTGELVLEPPRTLGENGIAVSAAEPALGFVRRETEGVFIVNDKHAYFTPISIGIAGERYFEVLSGLRSGDAVITGPFESVRQLSDGEQIRVSE
jgi:HlyD family secretion protein